MSKKRKKGDQEIQENGRKKGKTDQFFKKEQNVSMFTFYCHYSFL